MVVNEICLKFKVDFPFRWKSSRVLDTRLGQKQTVGLFEYFITDEIYSWYPFWTNA